MVDRVVAVFTIVVKAAAVVVASDSSVVVFIAVVVVSCFLKNYEDKIIIHGVH